MRSKFSPAWRQEIASSSQTSLSGILRASCVSANHLLTRGKQTGMTTNAKPPVIRMRDITKVFYTDEVETHALAGIHCDILAGEFVAISGPSGCGKSTLLAILGLLDTPTNGNYELNGRSVAQIAVDERAT